MFQNTVHNFWQFNNRVTDEREMECKENAGKFSKQYS